MLRHVRFALGVLLALGLPACGTHSPIDAIKLPPRVTGQIPDDYQLEMNRGVAVARVVVTTDGEPGFGGISNPLLLQFHPGEGQGSGKDREQFTVTVTSQDAYVFGSDAGRPTVWRYQPPGLLAVSMTGGTYDGLAIAYPDASHATTTPSSIPAPSRDFVFAPVDTPGDAIVYLGDIEIRQSSSGWDQFADKVQVTYAVNDNYDRTVADFRARYPQFGASKIERRVLLPVPQD